MKNLIRLNLLTLLFIINNTINILAQKVTYDTIYFDDQSIFENEWQEFHDDCEQSPNCSIISPKATYMKDSTGPCDSKFYIVETKTECDTNTGIQVIRYEFIWEYTYWGKCYIDAEVMIEKVTCKRKDKKGKVVYKNIAVPEQESVKYILNVFPNPNTTGEMTCSYYLATGQEEVVLVVYDFNGKEIMRESIKDNLNEGVNYKDMKLEYMANGLYNLGVIIDGKFSGVNFSIVR